MTHKPLPLKVGAHYYFTLASYEPVSITLTRLTITPYDVLATAEGYLSATGVTLNQLNDDWISRNYQLLKLEPHTSVIDYFTSLHKALKNFEEEHLHDQKQAACIRALSERLVERIPDEVIDDYQQKISCALARSPHNLTIKLAMKSGLYRSEQDFLRSEALRTAQQQAALQAYAAHKNIQVTDSDIARMFYLTENKSTVMVERARKQGTLDELIRTTRMNKATEEITENCTCTILPESTESIAKRIKSFHAIEERDGIDFAKLTKRFFESHSLDVHPRFRIA